MQLPSLGLANIFTRPNKHNTKTFTVRGKLTEMLIFFIFFSHLIELLLWVGHKIAKEQSLKNENNE